jgi:glucokinase
MSADAAAAPFPILIGDIGGTNARFSILTDAQSAAVEFENVRTADHANIDDAIEAGIFAATRLRPRSTVLALAAPIEGDEVPLTNCPWVVRPRELHRRLGIGDVTLLNDFEAQALATVALGPEHLQRIGGGAEPEPNGSRVILGPGTGLGVAGMVHARGIWIPVPGEGGHVDLGPRSARDLKVWPHLEPIEGRISAEQMLCGRGLVNIAAAVALSRGQAPHFVTPADITAAALAGSDAVAVEALDVFVTCLGRVAGDMALIFMAQGGIYLSGGIAQKIVPALQRGGFRAAFEDKAPHSELMRQMPVSVLTHPRAALFGLAAYAREPQRFGVETGGRRWIF